MSGSLHIQLNGTDPEALHHFLEQHPDTCQGHRPEWISILSFALGHQPRYLTAYRDGQIVGWLPMMSVKSILFGHHLVSMPYVNEAGLLADESATADALLDYAITLNGTLQTKRFELRHRTTVAHDGLMPTRTEKVASRLSLPASEEELWKLPPAKVRNQVKKGQKFNISVHWGKHELLDAFYSVFSINMRDLGTPVYPKKLFRLILDYLPNDAELCVLAHEGKSIACALLIHDRVRGITEVPSASCLRSANHMCANMLMYFHLLSRAVDQGAKTFDFGRSTEGSGTHKFKKQWRAESSPTSWQTLQSDQPEQVIKKEDSGYGKATTYWQKLPISIANALGPHIVRGIP